MVPDVDVVAICDRYGCRADALIEVLHDVQDAFGYVPPDVVPEIASRLNLSRAEVHGVVSFYDDFSSGQQGRHTVVVCRAEACQARGGWQLEAHAQQRLGVEFGGTTADGAVTLKGVYCLGNCALGPSTRIDGTLCAGVSPGRFDELVEAFGK